MKKYILILLISSIGSQVVGDNKPLMPLQAYMFYRRTIESQENPNSTAHLLNQYRFPSAEEQRSFLYADYLHYPTNTVLGNQYTIFDIPDLSSWLLEDNPSRNIPYLIEYMDKQNADYKKEEAKLKSIMTEKRQMVHAVMHSLTDLGADAMPYYFEFLKGDSEILYQSACKEMSVLFKNKEIPEEIKKKWIRDIIELIWLPNTPCRKLVIHELLYLDQEGFAPMRIEDWVSICFGEKDLGVYESVEDMYPKEFKEWVKKEGGFLAPFWWISDD